MKREKLAGPGCLELRVEEWSLYPWMDTGCGHVCAGGHPGEGGLKRVIAWKGARPCGRH